MCTQKMKIYFKENSVPYRVSAPRPIPLLFQEPANLEIARPIESGVIVPCDEPTNWCSPFFVPKGDGKRVRLVTDYTKLNKYVVRHIHPFPSVAEIVQSIPASSTCFAKLDATHGYFQLPLDNEASRLTTFLLPSGCYRYLCAPMGLSSSSGEWCCHSDRVVEGFPWCKTFRIVRCGSKGLTPTQQHYSTIELECFAIIWAVQKCSFYLRGLPSFRILTDHHPLEGIFQKDLFDLTSPRLQRMREKIAIYNFIQWTPGKTHLIADALSRAPLLAPKDLPGLEIDSFTCLSVTSHPSLDAIYAAIDDDYRLLLTDVPNDTRHSTYSRHLKAEFDSFNLGWPRLVRQPPYHPSFVCR